MSRPMSLLERRAKMAADKAKARRQVAQDTSAPQAPREDKQVVRRPILSPAMAKMFVGETEEARSPRSAGKAKPETKVCVWNIPIYS